MDNGYQMGRGQAVRNTSPSEVIDLMRYSLPLMRYAARIRPTLSAGSAIWQCLLLDYG